MFLQDIPFYVFNPGKFGGHEEAKKAARVLEAADAVLDKREPTETSVFGPKNPYLAHMVK